MLVLPLPLRRAQCRQAAQLTVGALAAMAPGLALAEAAGGASMVMQAVFGLLVVLAIMLGALWLLKRVGLARPMANQPLKVVGGVSVGSRERVMLVEVAGQWLVVGVAAGSVSLLAQLPAQELPATTYTGPVPPAFSNWLKATIDKRNGK
jgi:flagellar protein FliO/FliZ